MSNLHWLTDGQMARPIRMRIAASSECRTMDETGRPIRLFMAAGQVGDYIGAAALLDSLPLAQ